MVAGEIENFDSGVTEERKEKLILDIAKGPAASGVPVGFDLRALSRGNPFTPNQRDGLFRRQENSLARQEQNGSGDGSVPVFPKQEFRQMSCDRHRRVTFRLIDELCIRKHRALRGIKSIPRLSPKSHRSVVMRRTDRARPLLTINEVERAAWRVE